MKYRVFIGLKEIAGYYHNLKRGFEENQIPVDFFDLSGNPRRYGLSGKTLSSSGILFKFGKGLKEFLPESVRIKGFLILQKLRQAPLFFYAAAKYNVFIFGYHSTFFNFYELPLLKLLNKKIIYMYNGTDSRPPYLSGYLMAPSLGISTRKCIKIARITKNRIGKVEKYADFIINHPPQALFHNRKFIQAVCVGLPFSMEEDCDAEVPGSGGGNGPCRILHAPSFSEAKGSREIRAVIEEIRNLGFSFDYVEIQGRPNFEVLEAIKGCDFVVDQLYSDTCLAGFATEAAYFGKPAVVGGYYCRRIEKDLPGKYRPPSLFCHPGELKEAIIKMITDVSFRIESGEKARQYVRKYWTPKRVAANYLRLLRNDIPEDWWYDPADIDYLYGSGLSEEKVKACLRKVIAEGGPEALQLEDKPALEKKFLEFAKS